MDWCPGAELNDLLTGWSVAELHCLFPEIKPVKPKNEHVKRIIHYHQHDSIVERLQKHDPWVVLTSAEYLAVYRLLFFGDPHQDLSTFVLRDLGISRFEEYALPAKRRLFTDRRTLDAYLDLMRVTEIVHELGPRPDRSATSLLTRLWRKFQHRFL